MDVPLWVWLVSVAGTVGLLALSFFTHIRKAHTPSIKEAGAWTLFYVSLAVVFGIGMSQVWTPAHGVEFFAGYITEYSLSIDNLFVFVIIMSSFVVPAELQQRVLLIGIVIALVLRTLFILAGAAAIAHFSWVFYLFGLFLIITAVKLLLSKEDDSDDYRPNAFVRLVQKVAPTTDDYHGKKMVVKIDGKWCLTPLLIVMTAIGFTDILFALDSIPAIFGLTKEPYIVFAANAFALLGLIELYFLIGGLLKKLVYLGIGLALVLAFIGIKLIIEALHTNTLPFLNQGQAIDMVPTFSTGLSLIVILSILAVTTVASLIKARAQ